MTLRRKILLMLMAVVVPLACLTLIAYLAARSTLLDQAQDQVRNEARIEAVAASRRLAIAQGELAGIAEWFDLTGAVRSGADRADLERLLAVVDTWWGRFDGFVIVDGNGVAMADYAGLTSALGDGEDSVVVLGERIHIKDRIAGTDVFVETSVPTDFVIDPALLENPPAMADVVAASAPVDDLGRSVNVWRDRSEVLDPLRPLWWAVVIGIAVSLAAAVAVAMLLGRKVAARLSALTELTEAMSDGDWTRRSGVSSSDELGRLSASIDRMAEQVELDRRRRRQIEDRLAHQALHDPLTGLANRAKFVDRLGGALARSSRSGAPVAVLFCDLDNLKTVNDQMGHNAGDDLLVELASRMSASVRPSDTVARFGGDEFVVLCAEMAAPEDATIVAERLMKALSLPFEVQGEMVSSSASVGIAVGSGSTTSAADLVRNADAAMYAAKRSGKARYLVHDDSIDLGAAKRDRNRREATRAMDENELRLEFQPVLELENGRLHSVEALIRWDHPDSGVLTPEQILSRFGEVGLEADLDGWVIDRAAAQIDHWNSTLPGLSGRIRVGVNVTAASLLGEDLPHRIEKAVAEHSIEPGQLLIEVSENDLGADPSRVIRMLDRMRALGVGLVLDDFGSSHTSLERLGRYGADLLKIDHCLVVRLSAEVDDGAEAINAILAVTASLGIDAVAEGVEQIDQVPELLIRGCRYAQGSLFCSPLDDLSVIPWLERIDV